MFTFEVSESLFLSANENLFHESTYSPFKVNYLTETPMVHDIRVNKIIWDIRFSSYRHRKKNQYL